MSQSPQPPPQESSLGGSGPVWSAPEASRKHLSLLCPGPGLSLSVSLSRSLHFYLFLFFFSLILFSLIILFSLSLLSSSFPFLGLPLVHPLPPWTPVPQAPRGSRQQRELELQGPWERGAGWGRTPGAPTMQEAAPETQTNPGVPDPRPGSARPPTLSLPGTFPRFLSGKAISALPPLVFWVAEERPLGSAPSPHWPALAGPTHRAGHTPALIGPLRPADHASPLLLQLLCGSPVLLKIRGLLRPSLGALSCPVSPAHPPRVILPHLVQPSNNSPHHSPPHLLSPNSTRPRLTLGNYPSMPQFPCL